MFKDLNIVIGITGGIAAYKACGIVSYLKNEEAHGKDDIAKKIVRRINYGK